jgi:hypothetical protein
MLISTCYMCDAVATSKEHAPPRCIFPESQDTATGIDYRKNLIKVASCELHNSLKSSDDEYLLHVLAASYTSSHIGLTQFLTKSARAFEKAPGKVAALLSNSEPVQLQRVGDSSWEDGLQVNIDANKVDSVIGNCARALYFFETHRKLLSPAKVITGFTMYGDALIQANVTTGIEETKAFFSSHAPRGKNPDVFWYKYDESENTILFLMTFYSHSEAIVRFDKRYP